MNTPDPMLMEQVLSVAAASPTPVTEWDVSQSLGGAPVGDAMRALVREGLLSDGPRHSATDLGRTRATDALTAAMELSRDEEAAALVASMEAMAPSPWELAAVTPRGLVASVGTPSPALSGWLCTTRHALADYHRSPSLVAALRVRRAVRQAAHELDPSADLPPLAPGLVASAGTRSLLDTFRAPCESR